MTEKQTELKPFKSFYISVDNFFNPFILIESIFDSSRISSCLQRESLRTNLMAFLDFSILAMLARVVKTHNSEVVKI